MRKRTSVDVVGAALATALGLLGGCGGIASLNGTADGGTSTGQSGSPTRPSPAPPKPVCTAHPCVGPTPIIVANVDTGYYTCADGTARRRAKVDCPLLLPRAASCRPIDASSFIMGVCTADSDCTEHPHGVCVPGSVIGLPTVGIDPTCVCDYDGCVRDSDCGKGEICVCGDPHGYCTASTDCSTDQDCQPGCDCVESGLSTFQCQTPHDTCLTAVDCAHDGGGCSDCQPGGAGGEGGALSCTNPAPCGVGGPNSK